ncbi:MAG: hypothetical protein ACO1NQ_13935 [Flavobacteriales bacterium]
MIREEGIDRLIGHHTRNRTLLRHGTFEEAIVRKSLEREFGDVEHELVACRFRRGQTSEVFFRTGNQDHEGEQEQE